MVRLLGVDPGLRFTGWGVIEVDGNHLRHVADGVIATDSATGVPERLKALHDALVALLKKDNVSAFDAAPAEDKNGFVVTKETADKYKLKTLSDLAKSSSS